MKSKICPLLIAGDRSLGITCKGEDCAWFSSRNCCAVLMLAEAADSVADQVDDIAAGDLFVQQCGDAMPYYRICPDCGCSLDPGERCDCQDKEKAAPVLQHQSGKVDLISDKDPLPILLMKLEEVKNGNRISGPGR